MSLAHRYFDVAIAEQHALTLQHHASREQLLAEAGIDAAGIRAAVLQRWPSLQATDPVRSVAG